MKTTQSKNKKPHVHRGASQHTFKLTNRWVATNNSSSQAGNTQVAGLCENSGKLPQLFAQLPARTSPSSPMRNPTQLFFYWERPSHQHPDTHIPEVKLFFFVKLGSPSAARAVSSSLTAGRWQCTEWPLHQAGRWNPIKLLQTVGC